MLDLDGRVALVTGGANGIGRATAVALSGRGAKVCVADLDREAGEAVAEEVGGMFQATDVGDPESNAAAVEAAVERFGRLDLAHLNAGVATGCGMGESFDLARYRRAMTVNLDGVVFGVNAVLPALREAGGGAVVATASLAGLTAVPFDPIYAANKHAVVGMMRSLGPALSGEGIRACAVCPGFAETAIIDGFRDALKSEGLPIIPPEQVAEAVVGLMEAGEPGECRFVQAGRESEAFRFPNLPGPRG